MINSPANPADATPESIAAAYERDGYWIAPDLLSPRECDELKEESLRVLQGHCRPGASVFVGAAAASPRFYQLAGDPRIVNLLRHLMPEGVMFMSDKIVFKSAQKQTPTPWHIDAFYWRNTRPKISVWIPLDDSMAENGTLIVVPGSHRHLWGDPDAGNDPALRGEFVNVIRKRPWKPEEEVICEIRRGSAIFFSDMLAHASCENRAGKDRYSIIGTYHAPAEDEPFDLQFPARHRLVPQP